MSTDTVVNGVVEEPKEPVEEQKEVVEELERATTSPSSGGSWFDLVTVEKTLFVAGFMFVVLLWRRR